MNALRTCSLLTALLLGLSGCASGGQKTADDGSLTDSKAQQQQQAQQEEQKKAMADSDVIPVADSPTRGPADAPITVVEFSDFQCPFCSKGEDRMKELRDNYPDRVRVVFKHFPLPFHKQADEAVYAAMAAGEQGEFWEMHDKLFANQRAFKAADMQELTAGWAEEMGLDVEQFKADYARTDKWDAIIQRDMKLGKKVGVRGTPHFFVNGEKLSGAQPYAKFEAVVEAKLDQIDQLREEGVDEQKLYRKAVAANYEKPEERKARQRDRKPPKPATKAEYVPVGDDVPVTGATDDYKVTITAFSDFQCPFCDKVVPTLEKIRKNYPDQVRLAFFHRPLPFHKAADEAARAAWAAQQQGKFWEMHDLLFANQKKLAESMDVHVGFAEQLGLDVEQFKIDYQSDASKQAVESDNKLADEVGARGTPSFFINGVKFVGAQPYARFETKIDAQIQMAEKVQKESDEKLSAAELYEAVAKANVKKAKAAAKNRPKPKPRKKKKLQKVDRSKLEIDGAPTKGPDDAPVTIYEFSDFQCPFCARAEDTLAEVLADYEGKVRVVHKDFPLPMHKQAAPAARAGWAAQQQGKFWEMYEMMFDNQKKLRNDGIFVDFAKKLGLNVQQFKKDMNSDEATEQYKADMEMGKDVGVRGTPAFYINGYRLVGAHPAPKFREVIDKALEDSR